MGYSPTEKPSNAAEHATAGPDGSTLGIDDAEFLRRLADAVAWCAVADPAHELRTPALQPPHPAESPLGGFDLDCAERRAVVDCVAARRRALLWDAGCDAPALPPAMGGGRILLSAGTDENADEWDSWGASRQFFDPDALPPWDTWLAYAEAGQDSRHVTTSAADALPRLFLVSWVPPALLSDAEQGIFANCWGALAWADDLDVPLTRRLRELGAVPPQRPTA